MLIRFAFLTVGYLLLAAAASARSHAQTEAPFAINPLTGPSFPCPKAEDPLAQLFCTSPQLALLDMQFVKTYDALHQQVGPAGDEALRQEDIQLELAIRQRCGIALPQGNSPTPPAPAPPGADQCVLAAYQQQIAIWKSRLTGAAAEEANRSIPGQIALQARLQALGYLPPQAQLDSVFGSGTRAAIIQWQTSTGRQPTGLLGEADATALLATSGAPGQVTTTPPAIPTPANPASNVEQAWVPFIPYAACMSKNGFLLQTFVQEGVPPSDPIATAAIGQCKPTGSKQSEGSVPTSPTPSVTTPNSQPQTSPPAPSGALQQTLQSPPATANGPTPPVNSDGLAFSNPDGIAYANLKETNWTEKKTSNPLTDTVDITAVSNQDNGSGALAQLTASCIEGGMIFETTITDDSGQATVSLTNADDLMAGDHDFGKTSGKLRLNDDTVNDAFFLFDTYSNRFIIMKLTNDPNNLDEKTQDLSGNYVPIQGNNISLVSTVWRIVAEVDTDRGSVPIKIPIYDPAIEDVIKSCFK
jgi:peptidoglycan hydrolase-like protein with peptidoglycan-binding domain